MSVWVVSIAWALFSFSVATAQVKVGDTRENVFNTLGEPTGFADANGVEAYTFDRGRVVFRGDRVVSHSILSEEDARRERDEADRWREANLQEGEEMRDRITDDRAFRDWPARDRLAFWDAFRQRYPHVDTGLDHAMAAQQVQMEERQQIREMEMRLMEEERQAELVKKHAAPHAAGFYGSGFPLVFGDPLHRRTQPFAGRFDPHRVPVSVSAPTPDPMTARERFMPMQQFGHPPATDQRRIHAHDRRRR